MIRFVWIDEEPYICFLKDKGKAHFAENRHVWIMFLCSMVPTWLRHSLHVSVATLSMDDVRFRVSILLIIYL